MESAVAESVRAELILGRYRPLRPLGTGGSGSVWLARDELEDRNVALKVVAREGKAGSRAEREAAAVARLRHPGCVRAHAVERDEGHVYVVYEYLPGRTLREALRAGEMDDAAAVEAAAQILEALAHAHERGILHRDVKPANILLLEGKEVAVRVLDFGLAQLEEAETLTAAGDVPGTLAYIAPERLRGEATSGAADVWAVGVVLWEALAGLHPFFAASPVETARKIAEGAPPLAKARPDLPRALTAWADRALSLEPRKRPAPGRLAHELRAGLESRAEQRPPKAIVRRRALLGRAIHAAAAATFAATAAALLPFYPQSWPAALAAVCALAALLSPRAALALALAVPVLPLGNVSAGLAVVYAGAALVWLALSWRDARAGLLFAAGPLLSLAGAVALAPLVAMGARGPFRRALQAGAAVLAAAAFAGLRGSALPFSGEQPPLGLGIAGSEHPVAVAGALWRFVVEHPVIGIEALILALAAAAVPLARSRGIWGSAAYGACLLAALLLAPPLAGSGGANVLPIVACVCALCVVVAAPTRRVSLRSPGKPSTG